MEDNLKLVMRVIEEQFGEDYAKKNPEMVRFLMDKIQQDEYTKLYSNK